MKHSRCFSAAIFLAWLSFAAFVQAQQLWSGIIAPSRATTWQGAGVPGGIPDASWPICTTIAPYGTSASPASGATISNAIASCAGSYPSGSVVSLGAGSFYLDSPIQFYSLPTWYSNVVVRGQGADQTFLEYVTSTFQGCGGLWTFIDMCGRQVTANNEPNMCDWTAGYAQGTTTITLNNCGATVPVVSTNSLQAGMILFLDQQDLINDDGAVWNCSESFGENSGTFNAGNCGYNGAGVSARTDGPCGTWEGTWSSSTAYTVGQGVTYGGASYIAVQNSTNQTPGTATPVYWANCYRTQQQGVIVQSVSGSGAGPYTVTISPGLIMPTWASTQSPQAWWGQAYSKNVGIENLTVDNTNGTAATGVVMMQGCIGCWVKGIRSIEASRSHVGMWESYGDTVQDSYFFENKTGGTVSYGIEFGGAFASLVQNNIFQQVTDSDPSCTGACVGDVVGYNFNVDNQYANAGSFLAGFAEHAGGSNMTLWEGNIGLAYHPDNTHGTHLFETIYRNYFNGSQAAGCYGAACVGTYAIDLNAGDRYFNIIGNVLGPAPTGVGLPDYQCSATSNSPCSSGIGVAIYDFGFTGGSGQAGVNLNLFYNYCTNPPGCTTLGNYDPNVATTLFRWGNYDTVNASTQWNAAEVPSGLSAYSNAVPTSICTSSSPSSCPASFYYSAKPPWWPSGKPWPPIGPGVGSGNLLMCTGGPYWQEHSQTGIGAYVTSNSQCGSGGTSTQAVAGLVNSIPAMDCALNVMGMPPDGTGSVLSFNAANCYGSPAVQQPAPGPPTNLQGQIR